MKKEYLIHSNSPRKRHDELLKAMFKDYIFAFLRLMYPNADEIFDFSKGFELLENELLEIMADRIPELGKLVSDLLVKVYLKDGEEKWILIHIELEASSNPNIGRRLFQYFYRIVDKYNVDVETIVVFVGDEKQKKMTSFLYKCINTKLQFDFHNYHIFDHTDEELLAMDSIFGLVIIAAKKSWLEGKVSDETLNSYRMWIAKEVMKSGKHDKQEIRKLYLFLTNIIFVRNEEENRKLETYVKKGIGDKSDMGIVELFTEEVRIEAEARGKLEGKLEGKIETAKIMLLDGFDAPRIATLLKLSIEQIENIRKEMTKG